MKFTEIINSSACVSIISRAIRTPQRAATSLDVGITNFYPANCNAGILSVQIRNYLLIFCCSPCSQTKFAAKKKYSSPIPKYYCDRFYNGRKSTLLVPLTAGEARDTRTNTSYLQSGSSFSCFIFIIITRALETFRAAVQSINWTRVIIHNSNACEAFVRKLMACYNVTSSVFAQAL